MKMPRILVKAAPGLSSARLVFGATPVAFTLTPLFKSIAPRKTVGPTPVNIWHILTAPTDFGEENAWDVCHSLLQQGFGVAGVPAPEFAEPDLEQQWITGNDAELGMALSRSCDSVNSQREEFPRVADSPYWFRNRAHSQFDDAIAELGGPQVASKVRIAHFDTGYDPDHHTLPKQLRADIARNFVDGGNPKDATDRTSGLLANLGHGTGTLSVLAGTGQPGQSLLGGAPFAEIVPVRVANRVVLFKNSAIAQA